ncbi:MAG TPA: choice-of-anchor B family protein [Thermoanaerobaculia bacterium]
MRARLLVFLLVVTAAWVAVSQEAGSPGNPAGCGCSHACSVTTYQGCGCQEIGCFPGGTRLRSLEKDERAIAALSAVAAPAECFNGVAAGSFPCRDVTLQAWVPMPALDSAATSVSNLWGFRDQDDGREYAIVGLDSSTAVVDVTNPASPVVVGRVAGRRSAWREVKVLQTRATGATRWSAWAFVVTEANDAGLQVIDLSNLPNSITLATTWHGFETAHTVTVANVEPSTMTPNVAGIAPVLYVKGFDRDQGLNLAGILAVDVANPLSPRSLGAWTGSYGHDIWTGILTGPRAAACGVDPCEVVVNWAGGFVGVLNFTQKSFPRQFGELVYDGLGYAHSGTIARDGRHLFSFDELDERVFGGNSSIRVIDIEDPANPRIVGNWRSGTSAIEHNGHVVGDLLYVAHYERGLTVLDVRDPLNPREIGFFDTYPASDEALFHGAWGVYPYLPSGNVLVSNIDGAPGLFVLRYQSSHGIDSGDSPRAPVVRIPNHSHVPRP